jgi:DNA segregation ATPase FtsK/SpoIIIE, S-DNA-T family
MHSSMLVQSTQIWIDSLNHSKKDITPKIPFDYTALRQGGRCNYIKIGNLIGLNNSTFYPALIPLEGIDAGFVFELNDSNREEINLALQYYALDIISRSESDSFRITVADPKGMGSNFRFMRKFDKHVLTRFAADIDNTKDLLNVEYNKSVQIISECLTHYHSLSEYNTKSGHIYPYRIMIIADFPYGFTESLDKFTTFLENAKQTGLLVLMTYDTSLVNRLQQDKIQKILDLMCHLSEFGDPTNDHYKIKSNQLDLSIYNDKYTIQLDRTDIDQTNILNGIDKLVADSTPIEGKLDGLRIPIGKIRGNTHHLVFGYDTDNYSAMILGQTGSGKSVLLGNIIARGIEKYSPDELRYAIIDCGGGFYEFDDAPHTQLLCRSKDLDDCMKATEVLEKELKERETLFAQVKANNIQEYIKYTGNAMPRIIVIIDEYHVLYSSGKLKYDTYFDTVLIDKIVRIGRKFGMHLITCTQTTSTSGMRGKLMNAVGLRIALKMPVEQSNTFLDLKNRAAADLGKYESVYNTDYGKPSANQIFKVNNIEKPDIENIIALAEKKYAGYLPFQPTLIKQTIA